MAAERASWEAGDGGRRDGGKMPLGSGARLEAPEEEASEAAGGPRKGVESTFS